MKRNTWLYLFAFALLILGWFQYQERNPDPSFEANLLQLEVNDIEKININLINENGFQLIQDRRHWILSQNNTHLKIETEKPLALYNHLNQLKTNNLATVNTKNWEDFGLAENKTHNIQITLKNGRTETIHFNLLPPNDSIHHAQGFVRMKGQREVYEVAAKQLLTLKLPFSHYRPTAFIKLSNPIQKVRLVMGDSISKTWATAGQFRHFQAPEDSTALETYWRTLEKLEALEFHDNVDEIGIRSAFNKRLDFINQTDSFSIICYADTLWKKPFVLHSSQFPDNWLASDSSGVYDSFFSFWRQAKISEQGVLEAIAPSEN